MVVNIASGTTVTVALNSKSANLVTGTYENIGRGKITLLNKGSATGLNVTVLVGGVPIVNDLPVIAFGTTGTMDVSANVQASQVVNGGRVELYYRNTTGGGLTVDYALFFEPMR